MPAKSHIFAHRAHSPLEWRALILDRISDSHLASWVASVIAWDFELKNCLALLDLADKYSHDEGWKRDYEELARGLEAVGYSQVDLRVRGVA